MKANRPVWTGIVALALCAALAACASAPRSNTRLEQARVAVASLQQDPDAERAASRELEAAQGDLQRANTAFEQRESPEDVSYLAYLALREAQIGKARTDEFRAREQIARAGTERNRILLEARTREAARAQAAAQSAQVAARNAQAAAQQEGAAAQSEALAAGVARQQAQSAQSELRAEQEQLAGLEARETERGLELTLASDLLFNTGSATLKPGATLELDRLAGFMRANPQTRIIVEGYTDSRGSESYNQGLSQQRAQAVAGSLAAQGVAQDRIQAVGRGKDFPVASNATPEGRQQNRRVDIILSDMSGRFAQGAEQGPALR